MATTVTMLDPTGTPRQIPADQKDAALKGGGKIAVKMVDPKGTQRWVPEDQKDAAIQAGGKLADSAPAIDVSNPKGEGTYHFQGPDGKEVEIPYSKALELLGHPEGALGSGQAEVDRFRDSVIDLQKKGYTIAQEDIPRLYADYSHDPNLKDVRAHNFAQSIPETGYARGLAKTITGLANIVHAPVPETVKKFAETPNANIMQSGAEAGEDLTELAAGDEALKAAGTLGRAAKGAEAVEGVSKAAKAAKAAVNVVKSGAEQATLQGGQTYVKTGGDTGETERAAGVAGAVGVAGEVIPYIAKGLGTLGKDILRYKLKVNDAAVGKIVDDASKEFEANEKKIKDYIDQGNTADAARLQHDNVVLRQKAVNAQRQSLTDALSSTQQKITDRIQTINQNAKDYFKKGFEDVRAKLDAPDEETGKPHTVSFADLDSDIEQAEGSIKGSRETVRIFQDIAKKAQGVGETSLTAADLAEMSPEERREALELPGAKYSDLDGYYQEAGRMIGNPSTAPDVRQAVVKFREMLGKRMHELAEEVDPEVAKQHQLLRKQYREYAGGFRDNSGPSDSGSPVAKGLLAKDPYNATKPYMDLKDAAEKARGKKIVVGDTTKPETQFTEKNVTLPDGSQQPAWRYRKDTHQLIEHMRNLQKGLDSLPKADEVAKDVEISAAKVAKLREGVKDTTAPTLTKTTPESLQESKAKNISDQSNRFGNVGTWMALSGTVGGLATFMKTGDPINSGEIAVGSALAGGVGPYAIAKLLENPTVVKGLTKVTAKDLRQLATMPRAQRDGVESALRELSEEAVRKGQLKGDQTPWLRILASKAAVSATKSAPETPATQGESIDDIQKDLDQMEQSVPQ